MSTAIGIISFLVILNLSALLLAGILAACAGSLYLCSKTGRRPSKIKSFSDSLDALFASPGQLFIIVPAEIAALAVTVVVSWWWYTRIGFRYKTAAAVLTVLIHAGALAAKCLRARKYIGQADEQEDKPKETAIYLENGEIKKMRRS